MPGHHVRRLKETFSQTKQARLSGDQTLSPVTVVLPEHEARESAGLLNDHTT